MTNVPFDYKNSFLFIAGPCQIESENHCMFMADQLKQLTNKFKFIKFIFKSSFDKANRTSIKGERGIGLNKGLKILEKIKLDLNIPILTDVHLPSQVNIVSSVVDIIQIPAFLCRQTDLLLAAGNSGKPVNLKKGQFLSPEKMKYVAEKIKSTGNNNIFLCERGTSFGYDNLVVDFRSFIKLKQFNYPVIFDATHSVQEGSGSKTGGNSKFVIPLAKAAMAIGIDGLFIECHNNPKEAPSDSLSMLDLDQIKPLLTELEKFWELRK